MRDKENTENRGFTFSHQHLRFPGRKESLTMMCRTHLKIPCYLSPQLIISLPVCGYLKLFKVKSKWTGAQDTGPSSCDFIILPLWAFCEVTIEWYTEKIDLFIYLFFHFHFDSRNNLFWVIANWKCCVCFRWTVKGGRHTCTHSPSKLPPIQAITWHWRELHVLLIIIHLKYIVCTWPSQTP